MSCGSDNTIFFRDLSAAAQEELLSCLFNGAFDRGELINSNYRGLCSPPRQVDSKDVEFSACCRYDLGGNLPSARCGRCSL